MWVAAILCLTGFAVGDVVAAQDPPFRFGGFGDVTLYPPTRTPAQVALFFSGDDGWNLGVVGSDSRYPTLPELERLRDVRVTCIHGAEEKDSTCRGLEHTGMRVVALPGGHHFGGDYAKLAEILLAGAQSVIAR